MMAPETYRFQELTIHGFRRLYDVQLNLRPLSVMIGANGTGKTSMLDVLWLMAKSAQGKLSESISDLSGISSIVTYDRAEELRFDISMSVPKYEPLKYSLKVKQQAAGYAITEERLSQQRDGHAGPFLHIDSHGPDIKYFGIEQKKQHSGFKVKGTTKMQIMGVAMLDAQNKEMSQKKLLRPNWEQRPFETSLSQVPKMFQQPEEFRNRLASSTFYHVLNVDPRSPVRLPQPVQPATLPGRNGEELVSCLFYLRETDRARFNAIEDALRAAFPRFDRLDFPPVAAGTLALTWRETGSSKPFYMHQLSEGTLRFLWLATLLNSPGLTALTLLDEPEVSLHPELLNLLAEMMREASNRTQLVVATHSDRLIRFLQPNEVVLMDADEDGMTTVKWADELDLDAWLKDYSLDELWSNGRLGARA
jgi:predicted ATPase